MPIPLNGSPSSAATQLIMQLKENGMWSGEFEMTSHAKACQALKEVLGESCVDEELAQYLYLQFANRLLLINDSTRERPAESYLTPDHMG